MLPAAQLTHQMLGRLRVRIPAKRRDDHYFAQLEETLRQCRGVEFVACNSLAASVLIRGKMESRDVFSFAERTGLFTRADDRAATFALSHRVARRVERFDGRLRDATEGRLDLNGLAFLGLVASALLQVSRRRILPEAVTVLWYAANLIPGVVGRRGGGPDDRTLIEHSVNGQ